MFLNINRFSVYRFVFLSNQTIICSYIFFNLLTNSFIELFTYLFIELFTYFLNFLLIYWAFYLSIEFFTYFLSFLPIDCIAWHSVSLFVFICICCLCVSSFVYLSVCFLVCIINSILDQFTLLSERILFIKSHSQHKFISHLSLTTKNFTISWSWKMAGAVVAERKEEKRKREERKEGTKGMKRKEINRKEMKRNEKKTLLMKCRIFLWKF